MKLFKENPLYFSFLLPMIMDGILTLTGQSHSYWLNYKSANEMSPAYFFLATHPFLFIFGSIIWFVGLYFVFKKLKHPLNLMIACLFISGNSWGSTSWITKMLKESGFFIVLNRNSVILTWIILVIYFTFIGIVAGFFISQYIKFYKKDKLFKI